MKRWRGILNDRAFEKNPNAYEKWTQKSDVLLKNEFQSGKSTKSLADFFKRKIGAIRSRLKKLGLI